MSTYKRREEKDFDLGGGYKAQCHWKKTRNGFRHFAELANHNDTPASYVTTASAHYQNRTWERYQYQSVLRELVGKAVKNRLITKEAFEVMRRTIEAYQEPNGFSAVGMVAAMGDILCSTPKEANDWKLRMLKAGLPGIDPPADWDSLPEEEKTKRLNKVIASIKE